MDKCKWGGEGKQCDFCNPEGEATTTTEGSTLTLPKEEEQFFIAKGKYLWEEVPKGNWVIDGVNVPQFPTVPGTKVPKKPVVKEPEGGGVLDLPSPEDWVKKYFPKGSTVLGPARDLKDFQSKVFAYTGGTEGNVSARRKGPAWCWACSPVNCSHVLPSRQRCSCGCLWSAHYGHICNTCDTQCYPLLTLTGYWVSLPENALFSTTDGCTCSYCAYRGQRRGPGQTRLRRLSRPPTKPIGGAITNLGAKDYGLDPKLILVEAAANFYLLVEMGAMEPLAGELDEKFRDITARLADQLCLYLELACLGEFRYTRQYFIDTSGTWLSDNPHRFPGSSLGNGKGKEKEKKVKARKREQLATKHLMKDLRDAISTVVGGRGSKGDERMAAWSTWKSLYEKYGDKIYQLMIYGFREVTWGRSSTESPTSIGGPKWATCVEAAQAYRKGMPSVVFVDQALSLKHNGNIAFNKFFDVSGLDWVISWAFKGATGEIQHYATDDIRKAWQLWKEERKGGRDEQKQKQQEQAKGEEQSD